VFDARRSVVLSRQRAELGLGRAKRPSRWCAPTRRRHLERCFVGRRRRRPGRSRRPAAAAPRAAWRR